MTARFDIVAAAVRDELRRRVELASTREDKAALGEWAADFRAKA